MTVNIKYLSFLTLRKTCLRWRTCSIWIFLIEMLKQPPLRCSSSNHQSCKNPTNLQTWFGGRFCWQCSDTLQLGKWKSIEESSDGLQNLSILDISQYVKCCNWREDISFLNSEELQADRREGRRGKSPLLHFARRGQGQKCLWKQWFPSFQRTFINWINYQQLGFFARNTYFPDT